MKKAETIREHLAEHLEWLLIHNYSKKTLTNRRKYMAYFLEWADAHNIDRPIQVTPFVLEDYKSYLFKYRKKNGESLKFSSQLAMLVAIRVFFKWLTRHGFIVFNPAAELDLPKVPKRLPKVVLTKAEAEKVLAQPDTTTRPGIRDRAILELFYSTGMRRAELRNLKVYDIEFERGTIMIRQGKGKKDRVVPVGDRAMRWLTVYLEQVRPHFVRRGDPGFLFITQRSTPLRMYYVTELVREYINQADIDKKGACHVFRHTMATLMLEGGADVRYVQEMLGHASIETTQIYTKVSIRKLKEVHTQTHPARLRGLADVG